MSGKQDQIGLNWIQLDEKGLNKVKNLHCTVDKFSETSDEENSEKSKCWGVKKTTSSHPIFPSSLLMMEPAKIILKNY